MSEQLLKTVRITQLLILSKFHLITRPESDELYDHIAAQQGAINQLQARLEHKKEYTKRLNDKIRDQQKMIEAAHELILAQETHDKLKAISLKMSFYDRNDLEAIERFERSNDEYVDAMNDLEKAKAKYQALRGED
jgi:chromosome segregation ATPase